MEIREDMNMQESRERTQRAEAHFLYAGGPCLISGSTRSPEHYNE